MPRRRGEGRQDALGPEVPRLVDVSAQLEAAVELHDDEARDPRREGAGGVEGSLRPDELFADPEGGSARRGGTRGVVARCPGWRRSRRRRSRGAPRMATAWTRRKSSEALGREKRKQTVLVD